jgi:hypothetical protein
LVTEKNLFLVSFNQIRMRPTRLSLTRSALELRFRSPILPSDFWELSHYFRTGFRDARHSPSATRQLPKEFPVVAEEDPQPLGNGEDHLAVRNIVEQLLLGPLRPQKLAFLVAARAQAPELAGEGDEKLS